MHPQKIVAGIIGFVATAGAACAQTNATYLITFDGQVTPQNPTMTVGLWATWVDPFQDYFFAQGNYDLSAGEGLFLSGIDILRGPGSTIGVLAGNTVTGAFNGQLHGFLGFLALKDNPILLATYEWTTRDFTPRSIVFETSGTTTFFVAEWAAMGGGLPTQMYPHQFTPGRSVYVIPTPASAAILCVFSLMARRRRGASRCRAHEPPDAQLWHAPASR